MRLAARLRPDPLGELKRSPRLLGRKRGPTSRGRGGGKEKGGREEDGNGEEKGKAGEGFCRTNKITAATALGFRSAKVVVIGHRLTGLQSTVHSSVL